MKNFNKLTEADKRLIFGYLENGLKPSEIAKEMRRSISTITREIKKYLVDGKYDLAKAIETAKLNNSQSKDIDYSIYFDFNVLFLKYYDPKNCGVKATWNKIDKEHPEIKKLSISRIYELIKQGKWIISTNQLLKPEYIKGGKQKVYEVKRTNEHGVYNINIRRSIINKKKRLGDYEVDLINGTLGSAKGHLFVMLERKTRKIWIRFIPKKNPRLVNMIIKNLVRQYNLPLFSITCDNGLEFKMLSLLRKDFPNLEIYYCNPYASRERGMIENVNGIIRRFFPKGTDFTKITNDKIKEIEDKINNMIRESTSWESANDCFKRELSKLKKE